MAVRSIYIGLLLLLYTVAAVAKDHRQSVQVDGIELTRSDKEVTVKFSLRAGEKAVKSDYTLIVSPVLKNQGDSVSLPEIVITGNRARIAEARDFLATGQKRKNDSFTIRNGGRAFYTAATPYQEWMRGSQLILNGMVVGCCSAKEVKIGVVAEELLPDRPTQPALPDTIITGQQKLPTTGDRLSRRFHFLVEADAQNRTDVESFINNNHEGSLVVYFAQGGQVIDRTYKGNSETLVKLISAIRAVEASSDSRIVHIVIAGFASPEGTPSFNEQLAWDRGIALSRFVAGHTSLPSDKIYLYSGSVDWMGLRSMVEASDMYDKHTILGIIDAPEWNKGDRLNRLMNLSGGSPYRYMLTHFFPLLRNAACVKVYYENLNGE